MASKPKVSTLPGPRTASAKLRDYLASREAAPRAPELRRTQGTHQRQRQPPRSSR